MEDHGYIQDAERFGGKWYSDVEEEDFYEECEGQDERY